MEKKKLSIGTVIILLVVVAAIAVGATYMITKTEKQNTNSNGVENNSKSLDTAKTENENKITNTTADIKSNTNSNTNTTNNTGSTSKTEENKFSEVNNKNIDEIAKKLFENGSEKIRETEYSDYSEYEQADPTVEKKINGNIYTKRNVLYEDVKKEYSKIFTGEALEKFLNIKFADVDGYLYVMEGGASGYSITNIKLTRTSSDNNTVKYSIKYNDMFEEEVYEEESCNMTIKLENNEYKISEINYGRLGTKN